MTLPPGQRAIDRLPRFGTHLAHPAPAVPADPAIEVRGAGVKPFTVPLADLARLPRREQVADFHCVAGWSAVGLRWEGVAFATFYDAVVAPALPAGAAVTHLAFGGLDGYESFASLEDATGEDVLIAEHLDGRPLDPDHGAPVRLVSPGQYGFVSTKHLCRLELLTAEPADRFGHGSLESRVAFRLPLFRRHQRARVWREERHPYLPARAVRHVNRLLIPPIAFLCERGSTRRAR